MRTDTCGLHSSRDPGTWAEYDARGIYLCRVCPKCVKAKLSGYRQDVLTDPNYDHEEPLDAD
jgi:hypothetical protein